MYCMRNYFFNFKLFSDLYFKVTYYISSAKWNQ